ncbi:MFS transporter [Pseudonocardia acaciae]|uniref:MFS transporter n=1 Tax=Pseudonocardia acaciae TaxID=551276 RepID=UPI0005613902|nr:MFS transporter [Pseudonocardia acaciae]
MTTTHPRHTPVKALLASWLGTVIEFYDFFIYGLASSLIFARLFFPDFDPLVGTLIALSTFGVGYVARPLGAVLFGHFGDRLGRKSMLVVTLTMMGASTFAIGLLPTYQTVGVAAPVLLVAMRIAQGLSLGGEYGGAVLMTVEHASEGRRGVTGSLLNTGAGVGTLTSNLAFLAVLQLPEDALLSWGWRVPFLLSALLVAVGLAVRVTLAESPTFVALQRHGAVRRLPIVDVIRSDWHRVLLVAFGTVGAGVVITMTTVFSLAYGRQALQLDNSAMLAVLLPAVVVTLVCPPLVGPLADRFGVRAVFLVGAAGMVVTPFLWFALLDTRHYGLMLLGFALLFVPYSANYAMFPAYFSQVFPPALRYSGMSLGFTIGTIAGNAFAPAIATSILRGTGSWVGIAWYMAAMATLSVAAAVLMPIPAAEEDSAPPSKALGTATA